MTDFRARVRHGDVSRSLAAAATRSHPTCGHVAGAAKELDTSPWRTRAMKTQKSSTVIRRTQVLSVCAGCTPAACLRARTRATVGITKLYELRGRVVRASGRPPRSNCGMRTHDARDFGRDDEVEPELAPGESGENAMVTIYACIGDAAVHDCDVGVFGTGDLSNPRTGGACVFNRRRLALQVRKPKSMRS